MSPEARSRLFAAYNTIRELLTESELVRAADAGTLDRLLDEVLSDAALDPAFARLRALIDRSALEDADAWHRTLPSPLRDDPFNILAPRVIEAVRALNTRAIDTLKGEVRESVRQAAREGLVAGQNPRAVARRIRGSVGLSPSQEQWVQNFRTELETGDRAALRRVLGRGTIQRPDGSRIQRPQHAGGQGLGRRDMAALNRILGREPLSADQIGRMSEAYRRRLLALNTEAHTRSIALDSQRLAQRMTWEDLITRGTVQRSRVRRSWVAVGGPEGDGRNRPEHLEMHGEEVGFDERYSNGQMVPGETDFNCRCIERYRLARQVVRLAA